MKKAKKVTKKIVKKAVAKKAPVAITKNESGVMPLGDKVLVRPLSAEEMGSTTSFGLIIPDSAKEKPEQGTVVAVGAGKRNDKGERVAMEVKVGERVYFKKPWDEPIKIKGVEYYVISESDITLVVTK
jgi:chaperonin GroES